MQPETRNLKPKTAETLLSNLILSYPWWTVIPVILTGLLYAGLLYFRNRNNKIAVVWTVVLFVFRFLSVSLLALLLLSPFLRTKKKVVEKPVVVFAYDNSQSIILGKDSTLNANAFLEKANNTITELLKKYDVDTWTFAAQTARKNKPDFNGEVSDYAQLLRQINNNYKGANLGALVVFGDGIYNRGIDPLYAASEINFPIYTVALGDTAIKKDLKINAVRFNSLVYLRDKFPVEVNINANGLKGENATLKIIAFGQEIARKQIHIGSNSFNRSLSFVLDANKKGKQRISVRIETDADEAGKENNQRSIFIDILNNKKKVLILAHAPHPDLGAIKESIEQSNHYTADIQYAGRMNFNSDDYDLVVLHQLPSSNFPVQQLLASLEEKNIPLLYILGKKSAIPLFNKSFKGLGIQSNVGNSKEAQATLNPDFSLFTFPLEFAGQLENLPPLHVPLGNYKVASTASIFAFQEIKHITTDFPLIVFNENEGRRMGVITGEGLWLWRIHNNLAAGNDDAFRMFINKTVQLLMAKKDKRHFRVVTDGMYPSNKHVVISAELYNQSYEPVNESEVNLKLTNEDGEQFNYLFSPDDKVYRLDLKLLEEGVYRYQAQAKLGTKRYTANGEFVVSSQSLESLNLQANHRMLFRLSAEHDGKMLYPEKIGSLPVLLSERNDLKNKVHYEEHFSALHSLLAILLIILALLSLEWFLRKYFGSY